MSAKRDLPLWAVPAIVAGSCVILMVISFFATSAFFSTPLQNMKVASEEVASGFISATFRDPDQARRMIAKKADPDFNFETFRSNLLTRTGNLTEIKVKRAFAGYQKTPAIMVVLNVTGHKSDATVAVLLEKAESTYQVKLATISQ